MKNLILKRISAVILILMTSVLLNAEVPKHIQVAHWECIMDKLAYQGVDFNNSNGYLRGVLAEECRKIIGWEKR